MVTAKQDSIARLVELLLEHDTVEADGIEQCFAGFTTTANTGMNGLSTDQSDQIGQPSNTPPQSHPCPNQPHADRSLLILLRVSTVWGNGCVKTPNRGCP